MDLSAANRQNRNEFIKENKKFIYNVAYSICKRHLDWSNDDELSIAMIAFNNACNSFNEKQGNFFSYARVLIRNALIDYFRKTDNVPYLVISNEDNELDFLDYKSSITQYEIELENIKRSEEIMLLSQELAYYKLTFDTLISSCPSHKDTRNNLLNIALLCTKEQFIINYIKDTKTLPIQKICSFADVKRKLLERWRKYLLVLIIVLSNEEYIYIKSYLNIRVGDKNAD